MSEERRLSAIMFTDMVGYSALMGRDEAHARLLVERSRTHIRSYVERFHGEWLEDIGDGTLSAFPSAVEAADCALAIQESLREDSELTLRIGIHLGDVVFAEGRLYGDGVNVASRIESLARPGRVAVSEAVASAIRGHPNTKLFYQGRKRLKNVDRPIRVYAIAHANDSGFEATGFFRRLLSGRTPNLAISLGNWRNWQLVSVIILAMALAGTFWVVRESSPPPGSPELDVLRLYNEAQVLTREPTESDLKRAILIYRQLLEQDPLFVEAWIGLAYAYCNRSISTGAMDPREAMPLCKEAAEKALAIRPDSSAAHVALAYYYRDFAWDRPAAQQELLQAIRLDPESVEAHIQLAAHYSYLRQHENAFQAAEKVIQLEPSVSMHWALAGVQYYWAGEYKDVQPYLERAFELRPDSTYAHWLSGAVHAELGDYETALQHLERAANLSNSAILPGWLGYTYGLAGDRAKTQKYLQNLFDDVRIESPDSSSSAVAIAMTYLGQGEIDKALDWLERSAEQRSAILPFVLSSPVGKRLAGNSRYLALLKKVHLPVPEGADVSSADRAHSLPFEFVQQDAQENGLGSAVKG